MGGKARIARDVFVLYQKYAADAVCMHASSDWVAACWNAGMLA